jgi:hypothetical protein
MTLGKEKVNESPSTEYDRVSKALNIYEDSVKDALDSLLKNAIIDIFFIFITVFLIATSIFFSNVVGTLTTLGLGGVTAYSQGQSWVKTIKNYFNDSTTLKRGVHRVKEQMALCGNNDTDALNKVKSLIEQQFDDLDKAAKA